MELGSRFLLMIMIMLLIMIGNTQRAMAGVSAAGCNITRHNRPNIRFFSVFL
jgi:hypothetical protein